VRPTGFGRHEVQQLLVMFGDAYSSMFKSTKCGFPFLFLLLEPSASAGDIALDPCRVLLAGNAPVVAVRD